MWDDVAASDVGARVQSAVAEIARVVEIAGPRATERPTPDRWSILEYAAHVRDVLLVQRERVITASVLDTPTGAALYRDDRVNLGFYRLDSTVEVVGELAVAAGLLAKVIAALPDGFARRWLVYSAVTPENVTIEWVGAQAVHECEHHLGDVRENAARL